MSKRTPEQEAARRRRRYQTSLMNKCPCGNVASVGETFCGRCATERDELDRQERRNAWIDEQMEG